MMRHIVALGLAAATVMATQSVSTVPASLLVAARQSPSEFAMALANTSIPAGLEIRESDDELPSRPPAFDTDVGQRIPSTELLESFNAQRRDYRAVMMRGGVTVVRPMNGTLPFLDETSSLSQPVRVIGVMAAASRVFAALEPGLTGPVLNRYGRKGEDIPLRLDGSGDRRVIDTLNQIVSQAPGRAWMVTTREEHGVVRVISFGFIEADGGRRTHPMVQR